jgi:hypothetical protein
VAQVPTSATLPTVAFNTPAAAGDFSNFVINLSGKSLTINNLAPSAATGSALAAEIESRKANSNNERVSIYGRDYSLDVNVVPAEAIAEAKKELEAIRRRRRKIKDEMVSINVRTEIEVPEQVALVLTELGLD